MPRNIVICCDGTNNEFGPVNTNVVRLVQILDDAAQQLVYYDPGVGTVPGPGFGTSIGQKLSTWADLAFATAIDAKVIQAYCYLMNTWQDGDRVFMFGFSRGAYTVRVLAGLLHAVGLLPPRSDTLVPYALRRYASLRDARGDDDVKEYFRVLNAFQRTFARPVGAGRSRRFVTQFLGVWDTVSSVGWVWEPKTFPYTYANVSVRFARHAVALDERRCFFRQNLFAPSSEGRDVKERWFAGAHSDVGGGYPDGGLWRAPLVWMVKEASDAGLAIDDGRLQALLRKASAPADLWDGPAHESLRGPWWLAEGVFKPSTAPAKGRLAPQFGFGRSRMVSSPIVLHSTAVERMWRHPSYTPRCLSPSFVSAVRAAKPGQALRYDPADPALIHPA